ncbi:Putative ribonuclease H protein At1g65750, partial [Linum grandiflorum]
LEEALALRTQFTPPRRDVSISWVSADHPWSTLNTDGSVIPLENRAAAGGIIRDAQRQMLAAFAANLGTCTITRAEMSGVIDGMEWAWSLGVSHLEVQLDSLAAISLFQADGSCDHQHANLVLKFRRLLHRSWSVRLRHVYREANHVANFLANYGHSLALGSHEVFLPNATLSRWLLFDHIRGGITQAVRAP